MYQYSNLAHKNVLDNIAIAQSCRGPVWTHLSCCAHTVAAGSCTEGRRNASNYCSHGPKRWWCCIPMSKVWLH